MISASLPSDTHFGRISIVTLQRLQTAVESVAWIIDTKTQASGWRIAPGVWVVFDGAGLSMPTHIVLKKRRLRVKQILPLPGTLCAIVTVKESPKVAFLPLRLQLPSSLRQPDAPLYILTAQPEPMLLVGGLLAYGDVFRTSELPDSLDFSHDIPLEHTLTYGKPLQAGATGGPILDAEGRVLGVHLFSTTTPLASLSQGITTSFLLSTLRTVDPLRYQEVLTAQKIISSDRVKTALSRVVPPPQQQDALRRAAAVLWDFDPSTLRAEGAELGAAWQLLSHDVYIRARPTLRWELRPERRFAALRGLDRAALQALRALNPPAEVGSPQATIDAVLAADAPLSIENQPLPTLQIMLALHRWPVTLPGLPAKAALQAAITRAELLEPLETLTHTWLNGKKTLTFAGRADELSTLQAWADDPQARQALLITGIGGAGKSALSAYFILKNPQYPFAWMDFDRPSLRMADALDLLAELVRQLQAQQHLRGLSLQDLYERRDLARREQDHAVESIRRIDTAQEYEQVLAALCAEVAQRIQAVVTRLLVVLDSYEEIVPAPHLPAPTIQAAFGALAQNMPGLRVVVSGRVETAPPTLPGAKIAAIDLTGLDREGANALLSSRNVTHPDDHKVLMDLSGGNPLLLKLGADFVTLHGSGKLRELDLRREATLELTQGMLYRRILGHIHEIHAQSASEALLVLRRFDPALLGVVTGRTDNNVTLFGSLRRLGSMYKVEAEDRLEVRPDLRRTVLRLLTHTRPAQVRQVDEAALQALLTRSTPRPWERAEALFHRLRLDRPEAELDAAWSDELRGFFPPAILEELPEAAQRWLRRRTSPILFIPDEDPEAEAHALMVQLRELVETDNYSRADALIQQRPPKRNIDPELDLQVALIHLALGRTDEARRWLPDAVPDVVMEDVLRLAEAELNELEGNTGECTRGLLKVAANTLAKKSLGVGLWAHIIIANRYPLKSTTNMDTLGTTMWLEACIQHENQTLFLPYAGAAADPTHPSLLRTSIHLAGTATWTAADINAAWDSYIAPHLSTLLSFVADAQQYLYLTPTESPEANLRAVLLALPDLSPKQRPWLAAMIKRFPGLAEVLIRLTLQAERGSIWRRLRAALLSPMDS